MNAAPRRVWRPLRSFLILVCVGGAVIAADKTWLRDLESDFAATDWWSNVSPVEMPTPDIAVAAEPVNHSVPQLSMDRLLHGLLFSKPSTSWRLASEKTEIASAWMTQQSGETFATDSRSNYWQPSFSPANFIASSAPASTAPTAPTVTTATDGIWALNSSGNWSNSTNWAGGSIPDGTGAVADFSQFDLTHDVVVSVDTSRTIGHLLIGDSNGTNTYEIAATGGSTLTLDTGAMTHASIEQTATSNGDTISVPILFKGDLNIRNLTTNEAFIIAGSIAASGNSGSFQTIYFNSSVADPTLIQVDGKISNGTTGSTVSVRVEGGRVTFTNNNTYTGGTFITAGTLLVNGDDSATGFVQLSGAGSTLGGIGTVGGSVFAFGGTITGGTVTRVGTLTLNSNVYLNTGEGAGGTYVANLNGSTSDLLSIGGNFNLGAGTTLDIVGSADNVTTYTLATFASHNGMFETVMGLPSGYSLVYSDTDLELVPIPEPATWIGGALALGAIGFVSRQTRKRRA